jgi:nicotinamidase-related amidase
MATKAASRLVGKLYPEKTVMLLIDVQERFRPLIWRMETVILTTRYLTSIAKVLDIPVIGTQQYTKVFGPTIGECFASAEELEKTPIYEKKRFSACTDEVQGKINELDREAYIVMGIETHVCVQQTCLDLLEQGKDVHVIVDGVSSQQPIDRRVALERLQHAGAFLTTAQSAAFMLTHSADHPSFKAVSKLTVEHMKQPNEFNEALK